ncbi:MAG TPA: DUF2304 domain-containing protein [Chitinophagaceae bacterium]|jgi:hypothetical protein|nr:DUF2304 domain-containing protein [Chitinophagaceae bacterium]
MTLIQVILAAGIIFVGLYFYLRVRSSALDAVLLCCFFSGGLLLVFFPETSSRLARFLGVGRGADLVFYLSSIFFLFLIVKLYAKVRKLEHRTTELARKLTLMEGEKMNKGKREAEL